MKLRTLTALALFYASPAMADSWPLPDQHTDLIGQLRNVTAEFDDSFQTLAIEHGVGYDSLVAANLDLNPSMPGLGTPVRLPTLHILPATKRKGIVINLPELRLYHYAAGTDRVYTYPVGVGRAGWDTPVATTTITRIDRNPVWHPPASIRKEYARAGQVLPTVVKQGPDNPLGEYALRLALPGYLIHGTDNPYGVGMRVSHGCMRMYPADVRELASMISPGMPVQIVNQPLKWGYAEGRVWLEAHRPLSGEQYANYDVLGNTIERATRELAPVDIVGHLKSRLAQRTLFTGVPAMLR